MQVAAVVVSFDPHFSHMKLIHALTYLKKPSCHFVATNEDNILPAHSESVMPGDLQAQYSAVYIENGNAFYIPHQLRKPSHAMPTHVAQ